MPKLGKTSKRKRTPLQHFFFAFLTKLHTRNKIIKAVALATNESIYTIVCKEHFSYLRRLPFYYTYNLLVLKACVLQP